MSLTVFFCLLHSLVLGQNSLQGYWFVLALGIRKCFDPFWHKLIFIIVEVRKGLGDIFEDIVHEDSPNMVVCSLHGFMINLPLIVYPPWNDLTRDRTLGQFSGHYKVAEDPTTSLRRITDFCNSTYHRTFTGISTDIGWASGSACHREHLW